MKRKSVRELLIPASQLPGISAEATLSEAFRTITGGGGAGHDPKHRICLVRDGKGNVVACLDLFDLLQGLEPGYKRIKESREDPVWKQNPALIRSMIEHYHLWEKPMEDICRKAGDIRVKDIMEVDAENEFVAHDASLDMVINQMIMGRRESLLVRDGDSIAGVVRLSDVFAAVARKVEECRTGGGSQ